MNLQSIWKGALQFRVGRAGMLPTHMCLHIMDGSLIGTDAWFNNPACKASAHSGVGYDAQGKVQVHDYVHSADTAFAAGVTENIKGKWSQFKRTPAGVLINPNFYTLNLEHEGHPGEEISEELYLASAGKFRFWHERFGIPIVIERYVYHSEIYPGHNCPGGAVIKEKLLEYVKKADPIFPA